MDRPNNELETQDNKMSTVIADSNSISKNKSKFEGTERKSDESASSSDGEELPENILETEKHLHASAVKNNLDEISVRKILKKVVTNDHVLALVKLREEEEKGLESSENKPTKITRSKVKELMKASQKTSSSWKTWDLQLTPIKHIPVKTTPEVTALIAQDLPDDEDDDEYKPTHDDDAPSDDDQTLESCSDAESQPRTPATPKGQQTSSPQVVKDGPFVVPQNVTGMKRKLDMDEEDATIARRTRSKLSLSATSIEHIESTFVPPDDLPMPAGDDLWNQFLTECLDPASTSRNEDDDETDPEYIVAADPDAADEDDETLGKNILRISKKELNDLVTELFGIMPEAMENDELAENLATTVLTDNSQTDLTTRWEGKQEPLSDEEGAAVNISDKLTFENRDQITRLSIGKKETEEGENNVEEPQVSTASEENSGKQLLQPIATRQLRSKKGPSQVKIAVREQNVVKLELIEEVRAPPILRYLNLSTEIESMSQVLKVEIGPEFTVLPEQIQIMQQQLRQHIQLATTNFLQLYVHPIHWNYGPPYKKYIETFVKMCDSNPDSVANVCNLRPALEIITSWEKTVATDTPENAEMIKFIQAACERSRRRIVWNNVYKGDFHDVFKNVVSNSTVFLYPHMLPAAPYRGETSLKKFQYLRSEDELLAIGLDEFWQHIENNPKVFKLRTNSITRHRPGLFLTVQLVAKHMFPWVLPKVLMNHILHARKNGDTENPIFRFFKCRKVIPVEHKLLPFNPKLTLYEQPEKEMPRIWIKYLAKTSKRFKAHYSRSTQLCGNAPEGVTVKMGQSVEIPLKNPLPIDFTKEIISLKSNPLPKPNLIDKFDVNINNGVSKENVMMATNLFSVVETSTGAILVPLSVMQTNTVNSTNAPVTSPVVIQGAVITNTPPENSIVIQSNITNEVSEQKATSKSKEPVDNDHCECCKILRKICDGGQTLIKGFFKQNKSLKRPCYCKDVKYPNISNRLKLFISNYKCQSKLLYQEIDNVLTNEKKAEKENADFLNASDLAFVTLYEMRLLRRISNSSNSFKCRVHSLFSKFNIGTDDPVQLAVDLHRICNGDLIEIYTEFLGFLTAEQAETEDVFPAYLASHLRELVKMVCEDITNQKNRDAILNKFKTIFTDKNSTPCQTCSGLLSEMDGYPGVAKRLFSLFPHTRRPRCIQQENEIRIQAKPLPDATLTPVNHTPTDNNLTQAHEDHTPTNNKHTLTNKMPTLRIKNLSLTNKKDTVMNKISTLTNENNALTNENHALTNENHTLTNENHTLTNENHTPVHENHVPATRECDTSIDENNTLESRNHQLTNENHTLTHENHSPTRKNNTSTHENHTFTGEDQSFRMVEEELQVKQSTRIQITCDSKCIVIEPAYKEDTEKDATDVNSDVEMDEARNCENVDTMSDSSETNMIIIDEDIKSESAEWKRDEDKLILEMLKESLTPEERNDKTIIEILEEKDMLRIITDALTDKSVDEIQKRIVYLLGILVFSNSHK